MIRLFFDQSAEVYDRIEALWENRDFQRRVSSFFAYLFLLSLAFIHLNYMELLPGEMSGLVSKNHLSAVYLVFNLLLLKEILDMLFMIPRSITTTQLKQLKVLSLVLLRESFKHLTEFGETISWPNSVEPVVHVITSATAALLVFVVIYFFSRLGTFRTMAESEETRCFIAEKKTIALFMLFAFTLVELNDIISLTQEAGFNISVDIFFTIFVFSDILIVLISLRYSMLYVNVFRNSGFAIATVLIRISITAPPYYQEAVGIFSAIFAYSIAFMYRHMVLDLEKDKIPLKIK